MKAGWDRVLTSGSDVKSYGVSSGAAGHLTELLSLKEAADGELTVMPGGGISDDNVHLFVKAGFDAIHLSAKRRGAGDFVLGGSGAMQSSAMSFVPSSVSSSEPSSEPSSEGAGKDTDQDTGKDIVKGHVADPVADPFILSRFVEAVRTS